MGKLDWFMSDINRNIPTTWRSACGYSHKRAEESRKARIDQTWPAEIKIRLKGYSVRELRDYGGQLKERLLQLNQKCPERNRHSNKSVRASFDNKRHLVCDSDDLVVSFTFDGSFEWIGKKQCKARPIQTAAPLLFPALHSAAATNHWSNEFWRWLLVQFT